MFSKFVDFRVPKLLFVMTLLFSCVGCDQITKTIARDSISRTAPHSYFGGIVRLEPTENSGAFMSWGARWPEAVRVVVFSVLTALTLVAVGLALYLRENRAAVLVGGFLFVGGGIGNLIDRIAKSSVTDFLFVGYGPLHTGIFNVADMAIVIGVLIWMISASRRPASTPALVESTLST